MSTADRLFGVVKQDDGLCEFLWTAALGEPIPPDGVIYEYGTEELGSLVHDLLYGPQAGLISLSDITTGTIESTAHMLEDARTIKADVDHMLSDPKRRELMRFRQLLLGHVIDVPCRYCDEIVYKATEEKFEEHYRQVRCWTVSS